MSLSVKRLASRIKGHIFCVEFVPGSTGYYFVSLGVMTLLLEAAMMAITYCCMDLSSKEDLQEDC